MLSVLTFEQTQNHLRHKKPSEEGYVILMMNVAYVKSQVK